MSLRTPEPGSGIQAAAHPNPSCVPSCEVGPSCGALGNPDTPPPPTMWLQNQLLPLEPGFGGPAHSGPLEGATGVLEAGGGGGR